jgi:hypothetical protein
MDTSILTTRATQQRCQDYGMPLTLSCKNKTFFLRALQLVNEYLERCRHGGVVVQAARALAYLDSLDLVALAGDQLQDLELLEQMR